jgi:anti-sigma factor RsiW
MTGSVLPLHASEHAVADALLPWYVNGTLHGEELAQVERHLAACPQCQREREWLRSVFAACASLAPAVDAPSRADTRGVPVSEGRSEPRNRWGPISAGWHSAQPWMRGLMAAQLAALAVLGTVLALDTHNDPDYRTLGAHTSSATPARGTIAVIFEPATTEAELRQVITGAGARIVDGPTTTNAFVLEVPAGQSAGALRVLRAERRVRFAEALGAPESR